jgi:hypothetical protein
MKINSWPLPIRVWIEWKHGHLITRDIEIDSYLLAID